MATNWLQQVSQKDDNPDVRACVKVVLRASTSLNVYCKELVAWVFLVQPYDACLRLSRQLDSRFIKPSYSHGRIILLALLGRRT